MNILAKLFCSWTLATVGLLGSAPSYATEGDMGWAKMRLPTSATKTENAGETRYSIELINWIKIASESGHVVAAEIRKDGDLLAVSTGGGFTVIVGKVTRSRMGTAFPDNVGGFKFHPSHLLANDGLYDVLYTKDGEFLSAFQFEVKDGKLVPHPRQSGDLDSQETEADTRQWEQISFDVVWMERLPDAKARERFAYRAPPAKIADAATRKGWQWQSSAPADRATKLTLTNIDVENDATIRVGDEMIAFGTDFPKGVAYMQVGDTEARTIPEGETYDSKVFQACGKKIVLIRDSKVSVFNTENETMIELPETDILMKRVTGGNNVTNRLRCDGHLVTMANDVTKMTDRMMIKVIDISGETPNVISLKNSTYFDSKVDSIAVDAAQGVIVISSSNDDALYTAFVAPRAEQNDVTLTDHGGVGDHEIFIVDGGVVYADDKDIIRSLAFGSSEPKALTGEPFGRSGNGYTMDRGKLIVSTSKKKGTRFPMAVGNVSSKPVSVDGTGDPIAGTSGQLGMAGQAAVASDGTILIAGTPSSGIGVGEHLQILDPATSAWSPVDDGEGTVFGAADVVAGEGLVAFKYGDRKDVKLGLITFGGELDVAALLAASREKEAAAAAEAEQAKAAAEAKAEADAAAGEAVAASQQDMAFLAAYMQSEQQMAEAFTAAFGEEEGKRKAREMTLQVMKNNGQGHLVPTYEQMMK